MKNLIYSLTILFSLNVHAHPDYFWAEVSGIVASAQGPQEKRFNGRDCEQPKAIKEAITSCEFAGAADCKLLAVIQHSCRTKCRCS